MELVVKKQDQKLVIDTAPTNHNMINSSIDINHIIHALKSIQTVTTGLNTMIITIKTMQILLAYDNRLTEEVEKISEEMYNEYELGYNIHYLRTFDILNCYSLFELMKLMKIPLVNRFYLIRGLTPCNDIKEIKEGGVILDLKLLYEDILEIMFFDSVYLRCLLNL